MYVLIVEDDALMGEGIQAGLNALGIQAEWVMSARDAETAMTTASFDVVVLDLGLPDADGMQLLRRWRERGDSLPVLILTARDAVPDRVSGLQAGADDYLSKPFDLTELAARLHSLVRRSAGRATHTIQHGDLQFNPQTLQVTLKDKTLNLSRREVTVLDTLLQQPGRVVTSAQLQDRLYGWAEGIESNAVAVHIHNLRRKLGDEWIVTVRGVGYRLGAVNESN